jgi:hypothetical protein
LNYDKLPIFSFFAKRRILNRCQNHHKANPSLSFFGLVLRCIANNVNLRTEATALGGVCSSCRWNIWNKPDNIEKPRHFCGSIAYDWLLGATRARFESNWQIDTGKITKSLLEKLRRLNGRKSKTK